MVIAEFIDYLNKEKGWHLQADYYTNIQTWKAWWQNYVPSFHEFNEKGLDGKMHKRKLFRMNMAKQICEDWAGLLLNDKTTFAIKDDTTAKWLLGSEDQTGGQLRELAFWKNANHLVELAFRSGTGAFVLSCENAMLENGTIIPSEDAKIVVDYDPAECILPITVSHGHVIDCAFANEVFSKGKAYIYLQTHELVTRRNEAGGTYKTYRITNEYYEGSEDSFDKSSFRKVPLPEGMVASFETGTDIPWFSIITPNVVKNLDGGNGLGLAIFHNALDQLMHCDTAYNNYHRDIHLGGKKVFYNKRLIAEVIDDNGDVHSVAPDDVQQQLFMQETSSNPNKDSQYYDYNPSLRTAENHQAVQDALDYLSLKVGLGTHHYQFNGAGVTTATEYVGDRQDMVQHANKHQIIIEDALIRIARAIIYVGMRVCGQPVDPETEITVNWDDSYILDSEARRSHDKEDALDGFIPKYRYNMKWHGMSETEAKKAIQDASEEKAPAEPQINFPGDE